MGEFPAPVHVAADHGAAFAVRIIQHRRAAGAGEGVRHFPERALAAVPLKIQAGLAGFNHVDLFPRAFADVADENPPGGRIQGHPMRAAQPEAEELLQDARLTHERIVVGNEIMVGVSGGGLTGRRVADGAAAAFRVHPEDPRVEAFGEDLVIVADGVVAIRPIKEAVGGMKEQAAAVMPDGLVGQVHENRRRARQSDSVRIQGVAFEPVVIGVGQVGYRTGGGRAGNRARLDPGVIDK